jgi:hypothetical protein
VWQYHFWPIYYIKIKLQKQKLPSLSSYDNYLDLHRLIVPGPYYNGRDFVVIYTVTVHVRMKNGMSVRVCIESETEEQ